MADWRFVSQRYLTTGAVEPLGEITDLAGVSMSFYLNRPGTFQASLRIESEQADPFFIEAGTRELVLYRDGELIDEGFRISTVAAASDANTTRLSLTGDGFGSYLQDMLVWAGGGFTSTGQAQAAWDWINTAQTRTGGGFGITQGTVPSTDTSRTMSITDDTELLEAVIRLAERDGGFDFHVDAGRVFQTYYPSRGRSNGVVFDSDANVISWGVTEEAGPGTIVNNVRIRGGVGSSVQSAANTSSRATYGRREASIQYSGVISDSTTLSNYADRVVADRGEPVSVPTLEVDTDHAASPWGSFWIGDTVIVRLRAGSMVNLDGSYRIVAIHVNLDDAGNETVRVEVNAA